MLCAATSVAIEQTCEALERSAKAANFGKVVLFSDKRPSFVRGSPILWQEIAPLTSRAAYSEFMIKGLLEHVEHDFVLVVQWDGFATDPSAWDDRFLDYDYVGAPWPHFADCWNVGNGGFSLRSRKLLRALRDDRYPAHDPEDVAICREWRADLEKFHQVKFAPGSIAAAFAFERAPPVAPTFGFHGLFNFPRALAPRDLTKWVEDIPGHLLLSRDADDLIIALASTGRRREALKLFYRQALAGARPLIYKVRLMQALAGLGSSARSTLHT